MKNKNILITTLILCSLLVAASFAEVGCKSTTPQSVNLGVTTATINTNGILYLGSSQVNPAEVELAVQIGAKYGTQAILKSNPDARQYFTIAVGVIDAAIAAKNYDPAQLQVALTAAMPTANANTASAISSAISDGLDIYRTFYGQVVGNKIADASPYLAPSLQGLSDGISQALLLSAPLTPFITLPAATTNSP